MRKLILVSLLLFTSFGYANEQASVYKVQLYYGLSKPSGEGVTLRQWLNYETEVLAKYFDGFTVQDAKGYYKSEPERSKVVTIVVNAEELDDAKKVASLYAEKFEQHSVMMTKVQLDGWEFIEPPKETKN